MGQNEQPQLREILTEISGWIDQARHLLARRVEADKAVPEAVAALQRKVVEVRRDGGAAWRVLPLRPDDGRYLSDIALRAFLPAISHDENRVIGQLVSEAAGAVHDARVLFGIRKFLSVGKKREAGQNAARFLGGYHDWAVRSGLPALLHRLDVPADQVPAVDVSEAFTDRVGLLPWLSHLGHSPELVPASVFADLPEAVRAIGQSLAREAGLRSDALAAGNEVRRAETRRMLADMPVERLKDVTRDRLRISALTDAGITTVQAVLDQGVRLERLPGVGATTATRMRGAAQTLQQTTYDELPMRIDIKNRIPETTVLLHRLRLWDAVRKTVNATDDRNRASELSGLARVLDRQVGHAAVFSSESRSAAELRESVGAVVNRGRLIAQASAQAGGDDPWDDFLARPADYFALLAELGFITEDEQKAHGDLPDEIVEAVRRLELKTEHLSASLRGYQSFGARFALVQRKVVIGDEMGLGKTVEAIAVLAHLRAKGVHHFLVICPAAVVTNWVREVSAKSTLRAHRVHGPDREQAARSWVRDGGVAVTTFETLGSFESRLPEVRDLGCVIVDEAHYIKNPAAQRSRRVTALLDVCERAVLLTGTPLENRLEEFRNLIGYLRPDLIVDADELAPRRFRRQVAPAYLRRNQEDVLTELPELVEVEEWLPMSRADSAAYRQAVADGNFMAMRQAAMLQAESEKLRRLIEIVEEAEENGRRVLVFSHFRAVLDQVARTLPGKVFGPLTGAVPAAARQNMVDDFSAAGHGAVLVAQIVAGGVGLNIQAASVVVICEPQLKPTTEWQAIARARRMGQLESVQVHRLLSEESVDERVTEILARKSALFADFARESEIAGSAPEAYDISEADLAREVIAAERERLFAHPS
ncbi:DEAD/DEAH box helicase [Actinocorallia libanotica]|uniref:SNF2 domain-containing protein n=1 Tax=Actinocorallia libanotica TaxID=46162 RepID=A0ABP4CGU7_9ACTN